MCCPNRTLTCEKYKVGGTSSIIYFDHTRVVEWCVVMCQSKNKHKNACIWKLWLRVYNLLAILESIVNIQDNTKRACNGLSLNPTHASNTKYKKWFNFRGMALTLGLRSLVPISSDHGWSACVSTLARAQPCGHCVSNGYVIYVFLLSIIDMTFSVTNSNHKPWCSIINTKC